MTRIAATLKSYLKFTLSTLVLTTFLFLTIALFIRFPQNSIAAVFIETVAAVSVFARQSAIARYLEVIIQAVSLSRSMIIKPYAVAVLVIIVFLTSASILHLAGQILVKLFGLDGHWRFF